MAVVKGDAYGHGAGAVAQVALESGATSLGVFTVSEGCALRAAGIHAPILVFGPIYPAEVDALFTNRLTPTISSMAMAELVLGCAHGRSLPFHVEVDTGMTRGGVSVESVIPLVRRLDGRDELELEGVYTHFAGADYPDEPSAGQQLAVFREVVENIRSQRIAIPVVHAANSSAALHFPEARFAMVRAGIALYGYHPHVAGDVCPPLKPALSLLSGVSRVSHVAAGTGVGYGDTFRCERDSTVALIPVGYADGLHRTLGNGRGEVLIGGKRVPIVGRVSMDQITVDVTDIGDVQVGDEVVLIGSQAGIDQTADDVAAQAGTISYEVLTSLLPRVPRLYSRWGVVTDSHSAELRGSTPA